MMITIRNNPVENVNILSYYRFAFIKARQYCLIIKPF